MTEPLPFTTVVSGYPRTGTSTMMRMLINGGLEPVADERFLASQDPHDPYGAFEKENIAQAMTDLPPEETNGKAVKVVTPHITWMPLDRPLKVVFMLRDLTEVVASLVAMDVVWEDAPDESISNARRFIEHWCLPVHYVKYKEMVAYPRATALGVADFLELDLDVDGMATAVDPDARGKGKGTGRPKEAVHVFGAQHCDVSYNTGRNFIEGQEVE